MPTPQALQDYQRYMREKSDPRLRELSAIIHGLNRKSDILYWKIERAKETHGSPTKVKHLIDQRKRTLAKLHACKTERDEIRKSLTPPDPA